MSDTGLIPLEAVQEATEYCRRNPPEIAEDRRRHDLRAEAIGMNDPAIRLTGRPVTTQEF